MDNDRKRVEIVQKAIEQKCAFLDPDPYLTQRVLSAANEKNGRIRAKMPRSLLLALAMVLVTVTAVAISLRHGERIDQTFVATTMPDSETSQYDFHIGATATAVSSLASCGHANTSVEWIRRYVPIGVSEHKLVDTYYAMCHRCGEVFWAQDTMLLRESHDETMAAFTLDASASDRGPYTCKYCHVQWYGEEQ